MYLVSDLRKGQGAANVPTRREERIFVTEPVELATLDKGWSAESTATQNISSHGARVSTQRAWEPGSLLLIKSLRRNFWARARVVYWRSFSTSRFAIGLEFLTQEGDWPPSE
jgi:hypothetical protein